MVAIVTIKEEILAPLPQVFDWFYRSEHFTASPLVFWSRWRKGKRWTRGAQRDIIMIAGWYHEEITEVTSNEMIRYRVNRSFPPVQQDFTEISFESLSQDKTRVTWTIEITFKSPLAQEFLSELAAKMAKFLYRTILKAGKRALEG